MANGNVFALIHGITNRLRPVHLSRRSDSVMETDGLASVRTFFKPVWTSVDTGGDVMLACFANGVFPSHTKEATLTGFEPVLPP
jgi:hypothetical protein